MDNENSIDKVATALAAGDGSVGMMDRIGDGATEEAPQYAVRRLPPLIHSNSAPGGGGFGPADQRPPAAVLRDVQDGLVSLHQAREAYRVAIRDDLTDIDLRATQELRSRGAG